MNPNKPMHEDVSPDQLYRLKSIFDKKGWQQVVYGFSVFDNFVDMLRPLSNEQRDLVLLLTEDFTVVGLNDYVAKLYILVNEFITMYPFKNKTVCFCPLLSPEDFDRTDKSSTMLNRILIYQLLPGLIEQNKQFCFKHVDTPESSAIKSFVRKDYCFVLIDDFIGTGGTAIDTIQYLSDTSGVSKDKVAILALGGMNDGVSFLRNEGVYVKVNMLFQKGLTLKGNAMYIKIMQDIESSIGVEPKYEFGYGHSEALVKFDRTPNNTFPIFWLANKNYRYIPPFVRSI